MSSFSEQFARIVEDGPPVIAEVFGDDLDARWVEEACLKAKRLCEDCADRAREEEEIAEQSEAVVRDMMGFKGKR